MITMIISEKIDWMSMTFDVHHKVNSILPNVLLGNMERIKSPIPVYKFGYQMSCGAKLLTGGGDRLGMHLILTGKTLDEARERDENFIAEMYDVMIATKANVSRIDIAVDVIDSDDFTVDKIRKLHLEGKCVTRLAGSKFIGEGERTETFYIGDMKSKSRKFRVYDKAIEQGILDRKWIRLEYEKRRGAKALFRTLQESKSSIRAIINSVVSFPAWDTWKDILGSEVTNIGRGLEKENIGSERLDWIIKSVLPAMAKEIVKSSREYNVDINDAPVTKIINQILEREISKCMNEKI